MILNYFYLAETHFTKTATFRNKNSKPRMPTFSRAASTATRNQRPPPPPPPPLSDLAPPSPPNSQQPCRFKGSPRLSRWSLARAVRSARKLDRPVQKTHTLDAPNTGSDSDPYDQGVGMLDKYKNDNVNSAVQGSNGEDDGEVTVGKQIYLVSDGTGWTAEHSVNAALVLFEHFLVDRGCAVNTHLFSGIDDVERLMEIVKQAAKEGAMLVYTLANPAVADSVRQACKVWGVPSTDILSPIIEATASHLGVSPWGTPRGNPGRSNALSDEHFRRIEAVEFTIKQDDGALPQNLHQADIILVGVSRIGKTPLSIYLAQKGYKVANVPIVMGVDLPKSLFELEQENVFGLTINPVVLQMRRRARAMKLGFGDDVRSNYSEMDHVRNELEFAAGIFAQNPTWPVIEITGKGIEETAAVVLRLYHDRKQKCFMPRFMPRISKCY